MKAEWIYGLHAVQAFVELYPERVLSLMVTEERDDKRIADILAAAAQVGINSQNASKKTLDKVSEDGAHQGVAAQVRPLPPMDEDQLLELVEARGQQALVLVLDGITDPHNLGACLRTADAAGVCAVVVPKDRSAHLTAIARKVACGAAESMPLVAVTNLARCLKRLQQAGVWVVGTAGEASSDLYSGNARGPLAVVMGAEGSGMRRLTRECCDELVSLPMAGLVSSLNVSVATGIVLFELQRQRRQA